jgi:hypothetical protein
MVELPLPIVIVSAQHPQATRHNNGCHRKPRIKKGWDATIPNMAWDSLLGIAHG